MINSAVSFLHAVIDWFYPPFKKIMPVQTFRYAACGGGNTLLDIILFYISHTFILKEQFVETPFVTLSPHIAAFLMSFAVTFPVGFFLSRYVVFEEGMCANVSNCQNIWRWLRGPSCSTIFF
jgi:hypothetical protein